MTDTYTARFEIILESDDQSIRAQAADVATRIGAAIGEPVHVGLITDSLGEEIDRQ